MKLVCVSVCVSANSSNIYQRTSAPDLCILAIFNMNFGWTDKLFCSRKIKGCALLRRSSFQSLVFCNFAAQHKQMRCFFLLQPLSAHTSYYYFLMLYRSQSLATSEEKELLS